jgi:hypothetical protein
MKNMTFASLLIIKSGFADANPRRARPGNPCAGSDGVGGGK